MTKTGGCNENIDFWRNLMILNEQLSENCRKILLSKNICPEMQNLKQKTPNFREI